MTDLATIGQRLSTTRKTLNLTPTTLGTKAGVSRATIDALENGRARELGFRKISKLLAAAESGWLDRNGEHGSTFV